MRLWIDTNCAQSVVIIRELVRLAKPKGVDVVIHPQVYLERRRQMRAECIKKGKPFDAILFDGFLKQQAIGVSDFVLDQETAAVWADELDRRYPTDEEWIRAKQATIGGRLRADFEVLPGKMPMTTDWLIALTVENDAASRIITLDTGEEWRVLRAMQPPRALSLEEAKSWLRELPTPPVTPPAG